MNVMNGKQPYFLEGRRIYLREVRPSDVNGDYYRWMNDPDVTKYIESRFRPNSIDELREYVDNKRKDRDNIFLAIVMKEEDRHIGNIKLGPINWIHRFADVGIIIGEKDCWRRGYATEAIGLCVDYAFHKLNLRKVTAGCYADNSGSLKAFMRAGFEKEGVLKNHFFSSGRYTDGILLGLTRKEES